jgi:SAM-dependent methyltransferase
MHNPLADQIVALYERHAQAWHQRRNPLATLEAAWLERFVAGVPRQADTPGPILDLGCGTGQPVRCCLIKAG